jgi:hypothetical protein
MQVPQAMTQPAGLPATMRLAIREQPDLGATMAPLNPLRMTRRVIRAPQGLAVTTLVILDHPMVLSLMLAQTQTTVQFLTPARAELAAMMALRAMLAQTVLRGRRSLQRLRLEPPIEFC